MQLTNIIRTISLIGAFTIAATTARAVSPAPDGGYPNGNTAEGDSALFSLTTGQNNTATGLDALFSNTTGDFNVANGASALQSNTTGNFNTANGQSALGDNTTGFNNTANGASALLHNTTGSQNTANGLNALLFNTTGNNSTANGSSALQRNTTGLENTANGASALENNTTGRDNTATGYFALLNNTASDNTANGAAALQSNTTGSNNTANGTGALLSNTTGHLNIALGRNAGQNLTTGSNNIDIGNAGVAAESNIIRIGNEVAFTDLGGVVHPAHTKAFIAGISGATVAGGVTVVINTKGHLGTLTSSARFKDEIKPMDKASEAILALKPVTFRYKRELDPEGIPQFGLVAEQVEKVNPDLVVRDAAGKISTVRYEAVNAMLLNEFLKEHRTVQDLNSTVAKQEATMAQQQKDFQSTVAQQEKEIKSLTASLKEQASQIQKVSDQLEAGKAAPQLVADNQ